MAQAQENGIVDRNENPLVSLLVNIILPSVVLSKFSGEDDLGPVVALIVGLAFPFGYSIYEFWERKKVSFISVLGVISIILTGGVGLLKLDARWIAVKEAAIPAVIGAAIMFSLRTKTPLVHKLLYNEKIINVPKVSEALTRNENSQKFDRLLFQTSCLLAASFFLSAVLNYALARFILVSPPGSVAFNEELGRMTALSYPVIVLPSMVVMFLALWILLSGIKKLTGLELEQVFKGSS